MADRIPSIAVKRDGGAGYRRINLDKFDPKVHEPADDEAKAIAKEIKDGGDGTIAAQMYEMKRAERNYQANMGQVDGSYMGDGRNPSGTFSTPTPTDIRFPNKDATEFENNRGAFIGKSAAGLREEKGIPQQPGGVVGFIHIPDNWRRMDKTEMVNIAKEVAGQDHLTIKQAKAVLRAEINRRIDAGEDPHAETAEGVEETIAKSFSEMKGAELDEYVDNHEIEVPDGWAKMKVAEKQAWLQENASDE